MEEVVLIVLTVVDERLLFGREGESSHKKFINNSLTTIDNNSLHVICFHLLDFCYVFSFVVIHLKIC